MLGAVKVYGERNTGTRALVAAVEANFHVAVLAPSRRPKPAEIEAEVARRRGLLGHAPFTALPLAWGRPVREAILDETSMPLVAEAFGWKHAAPPLEEIERQQARAADVLFLVVTKHPLFFLSSLHRRPHHDLVRRWPRPSLSRFLRQPWRPVGRDLIGPAALASPVDLWRVKAEAYRRLVAAAPHALHVRYEDFVADYDATLDRVAAALAAPARADGAAWARPEPSTKGDDLSFADYARRYDLARAGDGFFREDVAFVNARLPEDLLRAFGYAALDPATRPRRPWSRRFR